jgi:threonine synthase
LTHQKRIGHGSTPLVESVRIGVVLGIRLFFKLEMCNPSGSYKDRFVAGEVERMLALGVRACIATSSGNTGAALASFSARYRICCAILVNESVPEGKLDQMRGYGARVFRVRDFVVDPDVTRNVYRRLEAMSEQSAIPLIVSAYRYCSDGMKRVEEIAGEITAQSEQAVEHVFVPVGGGGLFAAVCRGFQCAGKSRPKIHAVQPAGCATVVSAFQERRNNILPVNSTTRISGLSVPFDIDAGIALAELYNSGGYGIAVSDEEVFAAQWQLLREEGLWCEPAGATALAGCIRACKEGRIGPGSLVVCLATGHGFKDPESLQIIAHENPAVILDQSQIDSRIFEVSA